MAKPLYRLVIATSLRPRAPSTPLLSLPRCLHQEGPDTQENRVSLLVLRADLITGSPAFSTALRSPHPRG